MHTLAIHNIPLFKNTDKEALTLLLQECEVLTLQAGEVLLKAGEPNQQVFIVLSGNIAAFIGKQSLESGGIPIAIGECVGELSAVDGKPVSATVIAMSESKVLKLAGHLFWNELMALPGVASNLMVTMAERMRRSNEQSLKVQREQLELSHLRKELSVAHELQTSMLPLQRPLFPERSNIEICGFMEPTSAIGGDLFDAFFVDDDTLFVCIGDVSGHGIAAAMFMARTIGLLRILAMNTNSPAQLLVALNERLCVGNDTNLFVTLFCGFLDLKTRQFTYSNGGHCPPILCQQGQSQLLPIPKGSLLGVFPGKAYAEMSIELALGDLLFCYTDGVTEAQNQDEVEFSDTLCLATVNQHHAKAIPDLLDAVRAEVAKFSNSNVLEDDCTMLALRIPV